MTREQRETIGRRIIDTMLQMTEVNYALGKQGFKFGSKAFRIVEVDAVTAAVFHGKSYAGIRIENGKAVVA